jgi:hypothetical protein
LPLATDRLIGWFISVWTISADAPATAAMQQLEGSWQGARFDAAARCGARNGPRDATTHCGITASVLPTSPLIYMPNKFGTAIALWNPFRPSPQVMRGLNSTFQEQ